MKTYIYKVENHSIRRGYNQTITVYRLKNNKPETVGWNNKINTASSKGERAVASNLIAERCGHKISDGYRLDNRNIQLFEV